MSLCSLTESAAFFPSLLLCVLLWLCLLFNPFLSGLLLSGKKKKKQAAVILLFAPSSVRLSEWCVLEKTVFSLPKKKVLIIVLILQSEYGYSWRVICYKRDFEAKVWKVHDFWPNVFDKPKHVWWLMFASWALRWSSGFKAKHFEQKSKDDLVCLVFFHTFSH